MQILELLSRYRIALGIVGVVLIACGFAFEPVTRNYVATDWTCNWCHSWSGEGEYVTNSRMPFTKAHAVSETIESAEEHGVFDRPLGTQARCVDCHVPEGFAGAIYSYTHFISITDLFGHFRDRKSEYAGDYIPPNAARAYRVRDRLLENDSSTCRGCHVESKIVPSRERGKSAHVDAIENKETCIKCHNNLVHRFVAVRKAASEESSTTNDELDDGLDDLDDGIETKKPEDDELEDL